MLPITMIEHVNWSSSIYFVWFQAEQFYLFRSIIIDAVLMISLYFLGFKSWSTLKCRKTKKEPNSAPVQTDQIFFADSKLNSGFNQNEKAQIQPKVENAETRNQKSPENLKLAEVGLKMTTEDQILVENREVSDSLERSESKLLDLETEQAWDF